MTKYYIIQPVDIGRTSFIIFGQKVKTPVIKAEDIGRRIYKYDNNQIQIESNFQKQARNG